MCMFYSCKVTLGALIPDEEGCWMHLPHQSQFTGCLIGQCLGDALGFIVEGCPSHRCRQYVDEVLRREEIGALTRRGFPFGQYSDDSQLARELIQSFVACRGFDPSDYARRIAAIFRENRIVGGGSATEEAAWRLVQGIPWGRAGTPPPSAGNGSAMRAVPIGLFFFDDPEQMIQASHDQGRITHQDRRCSGGAIAISGALTLVLQQETIDPPKFVSQLANWTRCYDSVLADALDHMPEWIALPPDKAVNQIARVGLTSNSSDGWQGISPFVTGSVLWSLYAFLRTPDDYWETICTAIAVGGDVATTAAMSGAISGARVGLEGIASHLAKHLNDRGTWAYDDLVNLAGKCHAIRISK
jgi:ADP-ribosylglycohydrolase